MSGFLRRIAKAVGVVALLAAWTPALAMDLARPELIGFSADGRFVAFEEYGMQDASGFPYATIYVIDVAANDWVQGSPIRVLIDDSEYDEEVLWTRGIPMVRERALRQAQPVLDRHGVIPGNRGTTLIHHPQSDLEADPHSAAFSLAAAYGAGWLGDQNVLQLTERAATSPYCERFQFDNVMFTLTLSRDDEVPVALQEDRRLPDSRNCPTAYYIHSVTAYALDVVDQTQCCGSSYVLLVLVGMAQIGFEGSDWRYLGVTTIVPPFS